MPPTVALARARVAGVHQPVVGAVMYGALVELLGSATSSGNLDEGADRISQRILDAALREAATVGPR